MNCPKCKLINEEGASRCDCGYKFATGEMGTPRGPRLLWYQRARARWVWYVPAIMICFQLGGGGFVVLAVYAVVVEKWIVRE